MKYTAEEMAEKVKRIVTVHNSHHQSVSIFTHWFRTAIGQIENGSQPKGFTKDLIEGLKNDVPESYIREVCREILKFCPDGWVVNFYAGVNENPPKNIRTDKVLFGLPTDVAAQRAQMVRNRREELEFHSRGFPPV